MPITWVTYDKSVLDNIKELTANKDGYMLVNMRSRSIENKEVEGIVEQITKVVSPEIKHNYTINQLEMIFRKNGFYTTKEYPIKMKDNPKRTGRIDLVAREGKLRVAIEYDHHKLVKWKGFQKIIQIKLDVAIAVAGSGLLEPNIRKALKFRAIMKSATIRSSASRKEVQGYFA